MTWILIRQLFLVVYYVDYYHSSVADVVVVDLNVAANDECDGGGGDPRETKRSVVVPDFRFLSVDSQFHILDFPWMCLGVDVVGFDGIFSNPPPPKKKTKKRILNAATLMKHHRCRRRCHHHHDC